MLGQYGGSPKDILTDRMIGEDFYNYLYAYRPMYMEYNGEEWAYIRGSDFHYVNNCGQVISFANGYYKERGQWLSNKGYYYTDITINGKREHIYVHRLVATYFVSNPHNYPVVRHLDDDPTNNYYWNLEWGTQADNMQDCRDHDRDYKKPVYCYELDRTFRRCSEAADYFGVTRGLISMCCSGKIHAIQNKYHLCYVDDIDSRLTDIENWVTVIGNQKPIKSVNIYTGQEFIFPSRAEAARILNLNNGGISSCMTGHAEKVGDWRFEEVSADDYYKHISERRSAQNE